MARAKPPTTTKPRSVGLLADRLEEPRLADARLAGDEQELAEAGLDVIEPAVDELEQLVAADEERAANRVGSDVHGSQFRAATVTGHRSFD